MTSALPLAYVCFGSNYKPSKSIESGISLLKDIYPHAKASQIYKSKDITGLGEDYWNLVVQFDCSIKPKALKIQLQAIEIVCGRNEIDQLRGRVHLDLDILFICKMSDLDNLDQTIRQLDLGENSYVIPLLKELIPKLDLFWENTNQGAFVNQSEVL